MLDTQKKAPANINSENEILPTLQGISDGELNNLIRNLNLAKKAAELLASKLEENCCLEPGVSIVSYWLRERAVLLYLTGENNFSYCKNISGVLNPLAFHYIDQKQSETKLEC